MRGQEIIKMKGFENKSNKKKTIIITSSIIVAAIIVIMAIVYFCGFPVVKYIGQKEVNVEVGEKYNESGIHVVTRFKDISDSVKIVGSVDTSKLGKYTIEYHVPFFGKDKVYYRNVNVVDTVAPELTLEGDQEMNLNDGEEFKEPGFKANDNYDGDITDKVEVTKQDTESNKYEIHYKVSDSSNNVTELVRHIKYIDTKAPKLKLKGNSVISLAKGSEYKEQGATATDNKDGDVSDKIQISGTVDTSKEGTYIIKYTVTDKNGNEASLERKIIIGEKSVNGVVYLTFDDGPSGNITPHILDVLKEKGVKATFFILNYSEENEKLVKREHEEGHAIGIHGYSHDYSKIYSSVDACYQNIVKLQEKIYNTTGVKTMLVRFPGGSSNTVSRKYCNGVISTVAKRILAEGFKYYDWNVLSGDSGDVKTAEGVYKNVTERVKPGRDNIVLMHDFAGNNKTLEALPRIIDYLKANGYTFDVITTNTEMITQKIQN